MSEKVKPSQRFFLPTQRMKAKRRMREECREKNTTQTCLTYISISLHIFATLACLINQLLAHRTPLSVCMTWDPLCWIGSTKGTLFLVKRPAERNNRSSSSSALVPHSPSPTHPLISVSIFLPCTVTAESTFKKSLSLLILSLSLSPSLLHTKVFHQVRVWVEGKILTYNRRRYVIKCTRRG